MTFTLRRSQEIRVDCQRGEQRQNCGCGSVKLHGDQRTKRFCGLCREIMFPTGLTLCWDFSRSHQGDYMKIITGLAAFCVLILGLLLSRQCCAGEMPAWPLNS